MLFTERLTKDSPVKFESNKERIINVNTISLESSDDSKEEASDDLSSSAADTDACSDDESLLISF